MVVHVRINTAKALFDARKDLMRDMRTQLDQALEYAIAECPSRQVASELRVKVLPTGSTDVTGKLGVYTAREMAFRSEDEANYSLGRPSIADMLWIITKGSQGKPIKGFNFRTKKGKKSLPYMNIYGKHGTQWKFTGVLDPIPANKFILRALNKVAHHYGTEAVEH